MTTKSNHQLKALSIIAIILLTSIPSFAQKQLRIDIPKILENEQNNPELQKFYGVNALIYCRIGIEQNNEYVPIFTKMLIPSISKSIDRLSAGTPLPTYNIVIYEDKELLKEVRIALVIKKMREVCPYVW